ncbi:hypothetical protein Ddye_016961 [Dipteronia dyeriana]|uniref:Uncharacterized protein n=1 Tax=Dipteronia dyeriana TaxID=168575 RepID=A0AAD9X0R8_9ROSI|nr:hypothetical protein Ddye_016961 [Dipteronia dyeriana]
MASCFGHFMTMHRRMKFPGGVICQLLLWDVHHTGPSDEMHFILGNHEVRFSKVEFCLITGLQLGEVLDTSSMITWTSGIFKCYFAGRDEISFGELKDVLNLG